MQDLLFLRDVPPNSTVVGIPGRIKVQDGIKVNKDFNHANMPDPVADQLKELQDEIDRLKLELDNQKQERSTNNHDYSNL